MDRKNRTGLQIRFNQETEQDLIKFFSPLKKAEVHITAISAFRMYMRSIGFYEGKQCQNHPLLETFTVQKKSKDKFEDEGLLDEEALSSLDGMFDSENNYEDMKP